MNARRLTLVIATAVVILSLMTSYLGDEEATAVSERIPAASPEPVPTAPGADPGEVGWASWHTTDRAAKRESDEPVIRDIRTSERHYEHLPVAVRKRLERDYLGLDVALPRRNR
jgi:hypothetical protein